MRDKYSSPNISSSGRFDWNNMKHNTKFWIVACILIALIFGATSDTTVSYTSLSSGNDGDILQYNESAGVWDTNFFPVYLDDTTIGTNMELRSGYETVFIYGDWWDTDWSYFSKITINHGYIDADLKNFPVLVNSTDTTLIGKCQADGGDIRFLSMDNVTQFHYEIERWTPGGFDIWVNVSEVIDNDTDYQFLMYYGNSLATDNQDSNGVWNNNYVGVYHLDELSGSACVDSTSNDNNGVYHGAMPNQISFGVGYGQDLNSVNTDYISLPNTIDISNVGTLEIICKPDSVDVAETLWHYRKDGNNQIFLHTFAGVNYYYGMHTGSVLQFGITTVQDALEHYHAFVWATNDAEYRQDTTSIGVDDSVTVFAGVPSEGFFVGGLTYGGRDFNGVIDELRVSDVRRNNSWLNASFHSLNDTFGFLNFGDECIYSSSIFSHNYSLVFDDRNNTLDMSFYINPLGYLGAGVGNPFNQDLNTSDSPTFDDLYISSIISSSDSDCIFEVGMETFIWYINEQQAMRLDSGQSICLQGNLNYDDGFFKWYDTNGDTLLNVDATNSKVSVDGDLTVDNIYLKGSGADNAGYLRSNNNPDTYIKMNDFNHIGIVCDGKTQIDFSQGMSSDIIMNHNNDAGFFSIYGDVIDDLFRVDFTAETVDVAGDFSANTISADNGWSGTFTVTEGVVTVVNGIITGVDWD